MVPARGGSKAIPKKNVRILAGKPLITYVLKTISEVANKERIIVSTDDEDIEEVAAGYAQIHSRSEVNADDISTLDDVAVEVAKYLKSELGAADEDILMTIQPTSPFITPETIKEAVSKYKETACETVLTVTDDRHLRWTIENEKATPLFERRVNRQQMLPVFSETGGIISCKIEYLIKHGTRIGENISLIEVDEKEGLDIDTYADWALAEYWMKKLNICIRVDGGKELGFGHLYRALAIAQNIHSHEVSFVVRSDDDFRVGKDFLSGHNYPVIEVKSNDQFLGLLSSIKPTIVINDILDTEVGYIQALKEYGSFVVNFEDLGEGNRLADVVINDLYPDLYPKENHWYGVEHSVLNPNFEMVSPRSEPTENVKNIIIAYGGTDPCSLTQKALEALSHIKYDGKATVVIGPGFSEMEDIRNLASGQKYEVEILSDVKNMAVLMKQADLALTSAGRTVTELMAVGVPTIAMCQNIREMHHNHASSTFGIINLGMGSSITPEVLGEHINMFLKDINLRIDMYNRMMKAVRYRSNKTIVSKIFSAYEKKLNEV